MNLRSGFNIKNLFGILCVFCFHDVPAQDKSFARSVISVLTAADMDGRGYVANGDTKAADYISIMYEKAGLIPFSENFMQPFSFPVNTFPGKMEVAVDKKMLSPGADYQVSAGCPSVRGSFQLLHIDSASLEQNDLYKKIISLSNNDKFLVIYEWANKSIKAKARLQELEKTTAPFPGRIYITGSKLTWTVSREQESKPVIFIKTSSIDKNSRSIKLNIKSEFVIRHESRNVIGYLKGTRNPDSFIVITAHYDHLGRMGKNTYFPGGNDNASGIAMLLDLANYYTKNPPGYSIAFMAFAGEEAGLLGSYFYTMEPLFPLKNISFLLNIDLMGTGENGMTVVNASVFEGAFAKLTAINIREDYLKTINPRGKAANSDHHHFTEAGVPSFFFYLMGDYTFYHDIYDSGDAIKLNEYDDTFRLMRDFILELQQ